MAVKQPTLILVDAGELFAPATCDRKPWTPSHDLDTAERLLACYRLVHEQRPDARVLSFVEQSGHARLCDEWQKGARPAIDLSTLHCVPYGCKVSPFLLEFAAQKSAEGCEVGVVSNDVDVVLQSKASGRRWRHLGFMFVDGELVMPGLANATEAAPPMGPPRGALPHRVSRVRIPPVVARRRLQRPSVHRLIMKGRGAGVAAMRSNMAVSSRVVSSDTNASCEARSSNHPPHACPTPSRSLREARGELAIVSEEGEEEDTPRDSDIDGEELDDAMAVFVDADKGASADDDDIADTVADMPRRCDSYADVAYADTMVDAPLPVASDPCDMFADTVADIDAAADPGGAAATQVMPSFVEVPNGDDSAAVEEVVAAAEAQAADLEETACGATQMPLAAASVAQCPVALLVNTQTIIFEPEALLGSWVRDGGRTHEVCVSSALEGVLEFRPGEGAKQLPVVRGDGGVWVLNGFNLDETKSTRELLRWENPVSGTVRNWWRPPGYRADDPVV